VTSDRDRDAAGRPRNARPRDRTGRPLARDDEGAPSYDEPAYIDAATTIAEADRLISEGMPFVAHEVLEAAWKEAGDNGDASDRAFWRALAQLAVGLTHAQRGNATGAVALLRRGADELTAYDGVHHGVDVARVRRDAVGLASTIDASGTDGAGVIRLLA